jgi:hypothetical protein
MSTCRIRTAHDRNVFVAPNFKCDVLAAHGPGCFPIWYVFPQIGGANDNIPGIVRHYGFFSVLSPFLDLDLGIVLNGAEHLVRTGNDFVVRSEPLEYFDIRCSSNTGFNRMEKRNAVLDCEDAFFLDLLLDRFVGIIKTLESSVPESESISTCLAVAVMMVAVQEARSQFFGRIVENDDHFKVFASCVPPLLLPCRLCRTCSEHCFPTSET